MILENAGAFSSYGVQSRKFIQRPAGAVGQVRPRRRKATRRLTARSAESKCPVLKSADRIFTYNKDKRTFLKGKSLITRF